MNNLVVGGAWLVAASLALVSQPVWADGDPYEQCPKVFANPAYGSAAYREECSDALAEYRAQLDAWGIDSGNMSDMQAWNRYGAEQKTREEARREQDRRDALERERLAAERAAAEAEQSRIAAARAKQTEEYGAQQMRAGQKMMQDQNDMLKGLGVNLGGMSIDAGDDDEEYSATELQMYQRMVDDGAAPGCKGLSGAALVNCVDEVVEAE